MKIILSRKGFDSSAGEGFSPILDDGCMISFPIPEPNSKAQKSTYTKLESITLGGENLGRLAGEIYTKDLSKDNFHLDPDLHQSARPERHPKWKGAFGQAQASLGHLKSLKVKEGDLFLFFGNFKHFGDCCKANAFSMDSLPFHALFGYLQVGEILKVDGVEKNPELETIYADHPHMKYREYYNSKTKKENDYTNAIYIANDEIEVGIPGWGTFKYDESLRLSAPGYNKRIWKLPACFRYDKDRLISYHQKNENFFELKSGEILLKTVSRGQEFVIDNPSDEMVEWAMGLIRDHHVA